MPVGTIATLRGHGFALTVAAAVSLLVFAGTRFFLPAGGPGLTAERIVLASDLVVSVAAGAVAVGMTLLCAAWLRSPAPRWLPRPGLSIGLALIFLIPLALWYAGEYPGHRLSDETYRSIRAADNEIEPFL